MFVCLCDVKMWFKYRQFLNECTQYKLDTLFRYLRRFPPSNFCAITTPELNQHTNGGHKTAEKLGSKKMMEEICIFWGAFHMDLKIYKLISCELIEIVNIFKFEFLWNK
jgi:hypothetical protein